MDAVFVRIHFFGKIMNSADLTIRAYDRATDLEALSTIWFDASTSAHGFLGARRLQEQRHLIETLYLPSAETWVACHQGQAVGFISLLDHFVGGLFVSPRHQGLGAGRRLVAHALALKGELELEVYTRNLQAMSFYGRLGFTELSRRGHDDEGLPFENARMRLRA